MEILDELERIASEDLCIECKGLLSELDKEIGFVCANCVKEWMQEACWPENE